MHASKTITKDNKGINANTRKKNMQKVQNWQFAKI